MKMSCFKSCFLAITLFMVSACANKAIESSVGSPLTDLQYDVPKTWQKTEFDTHMFLSAPNEEVAIYVVKTSQTQQTNEQLVLQAWQQVVPHITLEVAFSEPELPSRGWNKIYSLELTNQQASDDIYQTKLLMSDTKTYAVLINASAANFDKRYAEITTLLNAMNFKGYQALDLSKQRAKTLNRQDITELKMFLAQASERLSVPGVAFAVWQHGEVLYEGGIGVADLESQQPISADTRFMVASNTKGMTTLLLAKLVELGKLSWEDRVIDHYPTFRLGDSKTTEQVRIKHLVCACTGLPRKDFDWMFNNTANTRPERVFSALANLQPTSEFGELYQYNNQMAAAAGYIAGHIAFPNLPIDEAYDQAMQKYVFAPLAMTQTSFSFSEALSHEFARPYDLDIHGKIVAIEQTEKTGFNHAITPYRPAGGAWSSVSDMLRYAVNELYKGKSVSGERVFSENVLLQRRQAMIAYDVQAHYGMGLAQETLFGLDIIQHGGSLVGYKSDFYVIEQAGIAAVIMVNSTEGQPLLKAFLHKLLSLLYQQPTQAEAMVDVAKEKQHIYGQDFIGYIDGAINPKVKQNLAEKYLSAELGEIQFEEVNGVSQINMGHWQAQYTTISQGDDARLVFIDPVLKGLELEIGEDKGLRTLTLHDAQHSYVFYEVK